MVVEDEAVVRFDISGHLTESGYCVLEESNSSEAFDVLETSPDVAFVTTDIDMPGIVEGLSLAKFMAEKWPDVRIIVICEADQKNVLKDAVRKAGPCWQQPSCSGGGY